MRVGAVWAVLAAGALVLGGCGDDPEEPAAQPLFAADYASAYQEVRDCRQSGDHDLNVVRVLADPSAGDTYRDRDAPFAPGAVVVKEEYDFGDPTCAGPIKQWTAMRKLAPGEGDEALGWQWQRVDSERRVVEEAPTRCVSCHQGCGVSPDGHDGTCTVP